MKRISLHTLFDKTPARRSYSAKVLLVAVGAVLLPGIIVAGVLLSMGRSTEVQLVAGAILASTVLMAILIRNLLRPIREMAQFVETYLSTGEVGELTSDSIDEVGELMRDMRNIVVRHDLSAKEIAEASRIDALTGLPNRRFSTQRVRQDVSRARRANLPVSLIAIDIDDFKKLNEKFGSSVGDVCLMYFADVAKSCVRQGDWIARWGGDEFLVLLWDADAESTEVIIGRIQQKLAQSVVTHEAGIRLTASFGYTTHEPGDLNHELLAKADAALFKAKKLGKNQMVGSGRTTAVIR